MVQIQDFAARTLGEIYSQPEMWGRALELAAEDGVLPPHGSPVLFLGCGTSYYIGEAYSRLRNGLGLGPTRAAVPTENPFDRDDETLVVLSRSGTTGDVLTAVKEQQGSRRIVGIVGTPGSPIAEACDEVVLLDFADETSIVQTRFASTALTYLRATLQPGLDWLIPQAEAALARPLRTPAPEHVVFLGTGFSAPLANEAALKCLESSGRWAEAYPVMEYQHGPISAAGPGTLVWPLVPLPESISEAIRETGAEVLEPTLDPQAELVAIHRLAVAMAEGAGRNPDIPPFLSRSVEVV